jgi:hypothetical protein
MYVVFRVEDGKDVLGRVRQRGIQAMRLIHRLVVKHDHLDVAKSVPPEFADLFLGFVDGALVIRPADHQDLDQVLRIVRLGDARDGRLNDLFFLACGEHHRERQAWLPEVVRRPGLCRWPVPGVKGQVQRVRGLHSHQERHQHEHRIDEIQHHATLRQTQATLNA